MKNRFALVITYAILLSTMVCRPVPAAITWTGSIDPSDPTTWTSSTATYIGKTGDGTITVDGGSELLSGIIYVGYGGTGQVTVDGVGSTWTNNGSLSIISGKLSITGGGAVIGVGSALGTYQGLTAQINVDGAGSDWTDGNALTYAGHMGNVKIAITNGGVAKLSAILMARRQVSTSQVTVDGPGSTISISSTSQSFIGVGGAGTLSITGRGLVSNAGTFAIDYDNNGNDSFVNMATGGALAIAGDTQQSITQFLSTFGGTKAIRYWNYSTNNWASIQQATAGVDYTLEYLTTGNLAGFTLLTVGMYPALPGDYNSDDVVDAADYAVWRNALDGTVLPNDTSPGTVDQRDYLVWKAHFGTTSSSASAASVTSAVPEPSTLLLLVSALTLAAFSRHWPTLHGCFLHRAVATLLVAILHPHPADSHHASCGNVGAGGVDGEIGQLLVVFGGVVTMPKA